MGSDTISEKGRLLIINEPDSDKDESEEVHIQSNEKRKERKEWTDKEDKALEDGVSKHGKGKWMDIKKDPEFAKQLEDRNNIHMKDRYRTKHEKDDLVIKRVARKEAKLKRRNDVQAGESLDLVNNDTLVNLRVLDVRPPPNQGIFRILSQVDTIFRQCLVSKGFVETHSPRLIAVSSEGGTSVCRLDYKGRPAPLAPSPHLHRQMAIRGDSRHVFEIGTVFREDSTDRHLSEFTGLDVEMEIKKDYTELMDPVERLFVTMFNSLNKKFKKELKAIGNQYPFEPLKYFQGEEEKVRLTFEEGVQMLKDAGVEVDPLGDLNTELERKLGELVLKIYKTDFYMLWQCPLAGRPFYTMPSSSEGYSNSFVVYIRGEQIISGAEHVNQSDILSRQANNLGADDLGFDPTSIETYIEAFRCGMPRHGGFGGDLERVVMLFCALNSIHKAGGEPKGKQAGGKGKFGKDGKNKEVRGESKGKQDGGKGISA